MNQTTTSEPTHITLVSIWGEDWEGLYVNGALYCQGHSLRTDSLIELMTDYPQGLVMDTYDSYEVNWNWLCWAGHLPDSLDDVVRYAEDWDNPEETE